MSDLKTIKDLPGAQQKMLDVILSFRRPSFRTSDVVEKTKTDDMNGRSVGAILGSLHKNGYLVKVQGGRDKLWRLSDEVENSKDGIRTQLTEVKQYWSHI
ncbi:MAG: hypothetical protein Q8P73_04100 [bacterium]|nr:hypothetical protein [bacterium]